jgi:hypothetical protein
MPEQGSPASLDFLDHNDFRFNKSGIHWRFFGGLVNEVSILAGPSMQH